MIEITRLRKQYAAPDGSVVTALYIERLTIAASRRMTITGPSGSGKSTFLSLLGGVLEPTDGDILWDGGSWVKGAAAMPSRDRARRIGFVFQELNLLPSLSLRDNLRVAARFLGVEKDVEPMIFDALNRVGLSARMDYKPGLLSRGEQQRAAIARTMLYPHRLILADEPTASLDEKNAQLVMELLLETSRKNRSALLVATHDPRVMEQLPDQYTLVRCPEVMSLNDRPTRRIWERGA